MKCTHGKNGFSLIELMVAVAVFSVVMVIAAGSLLTMIDANRKAQALKSVMNNLNVALEGMVRGARVGTEYHCSESPEPPPNIDSPKDCALGGILFAFEPHDGDGSDPSDQEVYRLSDSRLERSKNGGATFIPVTAQEVQIDELMFYVVGAPRGDDLQPKVVITLRGSAGISERVRTEFNLQTAATQRVFDL